MTDNIRELDARTARECGEGLTNVLHDCVEGGASVSFMWPFGREEARAYWTGVFDALERKRARLYAAVYDGEVCATVQLWRDGPCNQAHRGDIRKLLVHRAFRRRGFAAKLMRQAEADARLCGLSLLTLDTAAASPAESLYLSLGWQRAGVIPRYAKWPDGRYCDTTVLFKHIA